jgi:hypothetical protein
LIKIHFKKVASIENFERRCSIINNLNNKRFKIPTAKQVNPKTNARKTTRLLSVQPFGEAKTTGTPITSRKIKQQMQEELS